jgi:hypothetical protein
MKSLEDETEKPSDVAGCGVPVVSVPAPKVIVISLAVVPLPPTSTVMIPDDPTFATETEVMLTPGHATEQCIKDPRKLS